jgi:hypothetical protein
MAWGGLEGTPQFQVLPAADKSRIHNTLVTEITGKDVQENSATQSG